MRTLLFCPERINPIFIIFTYPRSQAEIHLMTPRFISKTSIGIWTLLLSPFLGTILFAYNLNEVGKRPWSLLVMFSGIIWTFLIPRLIINVTGNFLVATFISNAIASALLVTLVWNGMLGEYKSYSDRPSWKPILIFVGICGILLGLQWLLRKAG
jgi:hypothetical protein